MFKRYLGIILVPLLALTLTAGCTTPAKKQAQEGTNRAAEETRKAAEKTSDKAQQNLPAADMRTLQEVAADDKYTKGCGSCHVVKDNEDRTLKTYMKRIEEHQPLPDNVTIKDCLTCHRKDQERLAKLQQGLHQVHAKSKIFHPKLKATCVSCHSITNDGDIKVKGE